MRTLEMNEVQEVSGGTEAQCIAVFGTLGGIGGAVMGSAGTLGFGTWAGFEGGTVVGGLVGGLVCGFSYP